jgi:hypothetical protein
MGPFCQLTSENAFWSVQCSGFSSGYHVGDTLIVLFQNRDGDVLKRLETTITEQPVDEMVPIDLNTASIIPERHRLLPPFPNPFNPETSIPFELSEPGHVILALYNTRGQHVITLIDGERDPGFYEVHWNGLNGEGIPVPSGVYIIRIQIGDWMGRGKVIYSR